jgi:hypothetical protein
MAQTHIRERRRAPSLAEQQVTDLTLLIQFDAKAALVEHLKDAPQLSVSPLSQPPVLDVSDFDALSCATRRGSSRVSAVRR